MSADGLGGEPLPTRTASPLSLNPWHSDPSSPVVGSDSTPDFRGTPHVAQGELLAPDRIGARASSADGSHESILPPTHDPVIPARDDGAEAIKTSAFGSWAVRARPSHPSLLVVGPLALQAVRVRPTPMATGRRGLGGTRSWGGARECILIRLGHADLLVRPRRGRP